MDLKSYCPHCNYANSKLINFICLQCSSVLPLLKINYFAYFNLAETYKLSADIDKIYQELVLLYHPDKYVLASQAIQFNALQHTSYLNQAFNVLKDDVKRFAYYYAMVNQAEIMNEEILKDSSIAIEFFKLYEKLDNIKNVTECQKLTQDLQKQNLELMAQANVVDFKQQTQAKTIYMRLRYLQKLKEQLKEKQGLMDE